MAKLTAGLKAHYAQHRQTNMQANPTAGGGNVAAQCLGGGCPPMASNPAMGGAPDPDGD